MATDTDYEVLDWQQVKATIDALDVDTMRARVGSGWLGFFEVGEIMNPAPEPSKDLRNPVMWARYSVTYSDDPEKDFDPEGEVTREGYVRIALRYQGGTLRGRVLEVFRILRETFKAATVPTVIVFFVESRSEPKPMQAGWPVEELPIRFLGV